MPALYTITTRASGTILTAAIYNTDHQNHVNNGDAQHLGGFSANTSQMRTQTSPGDVGTESLSLSISDELARIRYMIALQRGTTFWYGTVASYNVGPGGPNYLRNSDFLTFSRQGQANKSYAASAGQPYTADQWYVQNGANQAMQVGPGNNLGVKTLQGISIQRSAGQTGVGQMWVGQPFTAAQIAAIAGLQVNFSIYAFGNTNFSATAVGLIVAIGTGVTAGKVLTFTGASNVVSSSVAFSPLSIVRISGSGFIPTSATQMEAYITWTPVGTAGAQDTLILSGAKLEPGGQPTPYFAPDPYVELAELQSWYYKTFQLGINPASNAGTSGTIAMSQSVGAVANSFGNGVRWPTRMIKAPTVTLFNPSAANAQARNTTVPVDCSSTNAVTVDESGCSIQYSAGAGSAVGQSVLVHLTAEAGL